MDAQTFARYFDSTLLKLDATREETIRHCEEAAADAFAAVCLYPTEVPLAVSILGKTSVKVATVIGFPSGRFSTVSKEAEIRKVAEAGAHEVDIVMNYPALLAGERRLVGDELAKLAKAARECDMLSKIIVETCFLSEGLVLDSLRLCEDADADFIKTSTGFGTAGAQVEHVKLWANQRVAIKIKASGGIRTLEDAQKMIEAGADRLGVSAATQILAAFRGDACEESPADSSNY